MAHMQDGRGLAATQSAGEPRRLQPVRRAGQQDGLRPWADAVAGFARRVVGNLVDQHDHASGSKARRSLKTSLSCAAGNGSRS